MENEDSLKASRWKRAFSRLYSLDYTDFHLPLIYATPEVIKVCDILATILLVRPWKLESSNSKEMIRNRCQKILQAWSKSLADIDNDFSLSPELQSEYEHITDWYRRVGSKDGAT
jgi:hypothetical protein